MLLGAALFALSRYGAYMDVYEKVDPAAGRADLRRAGLALEAGALADAAGGAAVAVGGFAVRRRLELANKKFFLKYMLSSQSAILWMSALFVFSTVFYWIGLLARSDFGALGRLASCAGPRWCWAGPA